MLRGKEDIEPNTWYKPKELSFIFGCLPAKIRALFAKHEKAINYGSMFPSVFKLGNRWQITGKGILILLDIIEQEREEKIKGGIIDIMGKKSFTKENPALQFLDNAEQEKAAQQAEQEKVEAKAEQPEAQEQAGQAKPFVYSKPKAELKTKRVQFVFKPSLYEKLKAEAKKNNTSVNDFVSQLLESYFAE